MLESNAKEYPAGLIADSDVMTLGKAIFQSFILSAYLSAACSGSILWSFAGQPGNQVSTAATIGFANLTVGDIVRGSGITATLGAGSMNSFGFSTGGIDLTDYYGFALTADPGFVLNLTSLLFSERRSATGIRTIEVRSSLDAFASAISTIGVPDDTLTRRQTVDLTAVLFQNLTGIEFRIYGYSAETSVGTWRLGISASPDNPGGFPSDVTLNATVAASGVPEPGTFLLSGLGLMLTGILRARR